MADPSKTLGIEDHDDSRLVKACKSTNAIGLQICNNSIELIFGMLGIFLSRSKIADIQMFEHQ